MVLTNEGIEELQTRAADAAKARHNDVLPDGFSVVWRRFGNRGGGRWEARAPRATSYCGDDRALAERDIWWYVWCEDDHQARAAGAPGV